MHQNEMIFLIGKCSDSRCFAILPNLLWQRFRAEESLEIADKALAQIGLAFGDLVQVFLAVQSKSNLAIFLPEDCDSEGIFEAADGAIHTMIRRYCRAWETRGILLEFQR
jgi:hypothetical protein